MFISENGFRGDGGKGMRIAQTTPPCLDYFLA
jgi:hypothetical protein